MKNAYVLPLLAIATAIFASNSGHASSAHTAGTSEQITFVLALPFVAPINTTKGAADSTYDGPAKANYLKFAAVEAAEFIAGAEMGYHLTALAEANPTLTEDQLIERVLIESEGL